MYLQRFQKVVTGVRKQFPNSPWITTQQAEDLLKNQHQKVLLIDARYLLIDLNQNHGSSRSLNAAGYRKLNSGKCFLFLLFIYNFRLFLSKSCLDYPNHDSFL